MLDRTKMYIIHNINDPDVSYPVNNTNNDSLTTNVFEEFNNRRFMKLNEQPDFENKKLFSNRTSLSLIPGYFIGEYSRENSNNINSAPKLLKIYYDNKEYLLGKVLKNKFPQVQIQTVNLKEILPDSFEYQIFRSTYDPTDPDDPYNGSDDTPQPEIKNLAAPSTIHSFQKTISMDEDEFKELKKIIKKLESAGNANLAIKDYSGEGKNKKTFFYKSQAGFKKIISQIQKLKDQISTIETELKKPNLRESKFNELQIKQLTLQEQLERLRTQYNSLENSQAIWDSMQTSIHNPNYNENLLTRLSSGANLKPDKTKSILLNKDRLSIQDRAKVEEFKLLLPHLNILAHQIEFVRDFYRLARMVDQGRVEEELGQVDHLPRYLGNIEDEKNNNATTAPDREGESIFLQAGTKSNKRFFSNVSPTSENESSDESSVASNESDLKETFPRNIYSIGDFMSFIKQHQGNVNFNHSKYNNYLSQIKDLVGAPGFIFQPFNPNYSSQDAGLTPYLLALKYCRQPEILDIFFKTFRAQKYGNYIFNTIVKGNSEFHNWSALMFAAVYNEPKNLKNLLEQPTSSSKNAKPLSTDELKKLVNYKLSNGQTALDLIAATSGLNEKNCLTNAEFLIKAGAEITPKMVTAAYDNGYYDLGTLFENKLNNSQQIRPNNSDVTTEDETRNSNKRQRMK